MSLTVWANNQRRLLGIEREAEITTLEEQFSTLSGPECEAMGLSIINLRLGDASMGLFGRFSVSLRKINKKSIPHVFKVGDEVNISSRRDNTNVNIPGTVCELSSHEIKVAIDSWERIYNDIDDVVRLNTRVSDVTHNKMMKCINMLETCQHPLLMALYGYSHPLEIPSVHIQKIKTFVDKNLNESQRNAVELAMSSSVVTIIHGPPGTGKTQTITEVILQAVSRGNRVLVAAPSNIAVDNILARVLRSDSHQPMCVRLGHPTRIHKSVLDYCLEALIERDEASAIVADVKEEIKKIQNDMRQRKNNINWHEATRELKQLKAELKSREQSVVKNIIGRGNVIFATCIGADSSLLRDQEFDLIVIDEAAQALEVASWIPIIKGRKVVLAGDHCQLPPTIKSTEAERAGLGLSLFEKIIDNKLYQSHVRLLNVQYRMNDNICKWASKSMYRDALLSHHSVATHSLNDILHRQSVSESHEENELHPVMTFIDTAGCDMEETATLEGSHSNQHEASIVKRYVTLLVRHGVNPAEIGVITPYNGQVDLIREYFANDESKESEEIFSKVEIRTVDGFQGGEKECIVLSLVRSNEQKTVGFLADRRRINVAVTRARRQVVVIGDGETCESDGFIESLLNHIKENGDHRCALELAGDDWESTSIMFDPSISDTSASANENQNQIGKEDRHEEKNNAKTQAIGKSSVNNKKQSATKKVNNNNNKAEIMKPPVALQQPIYAAPSTDTIFEELLLDMLTRVSTVVNEFNSSKSQNHSSIAFSFKQKVTTWMETWKIIVRTNDEFVVVAFPPSLSAFHRRLVHEKCEALNMQHESKGVDENRYIEASMKLKRVSVSVEASKYITTVFSNKFSQLSMNSQPVPPPAPIAPNPTQLSTANVSTNHKKAKTKVKAEVMNEDDFLSQCIQENEKIKKENQYRLSATAMPNPMVEKRRETLQKILNESQNSRKAKPGKDNKKK